MQCERCGGEGSGWGSVIAECPILADGIYLQKRTWNIAAGSRFGADRATQLAIRRLVTESDCHP
ncbi:hypothetical protein ABH995_000864 [Bradyrhizobium yuanmingense]